MTDDDKAKGGRPPKGLSSKLVVKITPALEKAINARVDAVNAEAARKGSLEVVDRSTVVRGILARALAAELKAAAG